MGDKKIGRKVILQGKPAESMSKDMQLGRTLLKRGDFIGRVSRRVDLRDFTLQEIADRAMEEIPPHTHEEAHFLLIIDGLYITSASGVDRLCQSSTLIFNPRGTTHHDRFHTRGGRFLTVSIKSDALACAGSSTVFTDHPIGFSGGEVSWLGLTLYKEFRRPDSMSAIVLEGLALELLGRALRSRIKSDTRPPRWLQLAEQLMRDRFAEPLYVSEIAESVGAHPVYLVSEFRKHYGLTIGEYLRRLRVEFACRQMSVTHAPLSQVAAAAGFYDQSHFTRTFKRLTGMTPTEYRAMSRP